MARLFCLARWFQITAVTAFAALTVWHAVGINEKKKIANCKTDNFPPHSTARSFLIEQLNRKDGGIAGGAHGTSSG